MTTSGELLPRYSPVLSTTLPLPLLLALVVSSASHLPDGCCRTAWQFESFVSESGCSSSTRQQMNFPWPGLPLVVMSQQPSGCHSRSVT